MCRRLSSATLLLVGVLLVGSFATGVCAANWPTFHGANTRQGDDSSDPGLVHPVALWTSAQLDGDLYAQPLIEGDQVIQATENNTVYSLNASTGAVQWHTHLGTPRTSAITCGDINPQGITSTPVIDGGNVYVVANIQTSSSSFNFELASLSLSTGAINWTANVDPPDTSNPSGITWSSEELTMEDRGALLVADFRVFLPMGGNYGDCDGYHGYVVSYPEAGPGNGSLDWWASSEVDAGDSQGADWAAGGLSEDAVGDIFVATGNSNHDGASDAYDYGDSVIKLDPNALTPGVPLDYFAPSDWYRDNANDSDLGSSTPLQLPNDRVFQVGKSGVGYLLNSASLGHIGGQIAEHQVCHATNDAAFGTVAYANGTVFVGCSDGLAAVTIAASNDNFSTLWYNTTNVANHPPTVAGGLVWSVSSSGNTLLGFSVSSGALVESLPVTGSTHFTTPSAANDQLYVAGGQYVDAFIGIPPDAAVAVRGTDGGAWTLEGVDSASPVFSGIWTSEGGGILEAPAVVSVPTGTGAGQPLYVATGVDHDVWVSLGGGGWGRLSASPVYCSDAPSATVVASTPGSTAAYTLVVACRGLNGALWWVSGPVSSGVLPSGFAGWSSLGGQIEPGISAGPAVAAVEPPSGTPISFSDELTFFVNGVDGRVWETTASGGWTPTGWACNGHLAAAAFQTGGTLTSAFACQGVGGAVWAATTTGAGWDTQLLGGQVIDGPGIAISSTSWTVVVEGTNRALWQNTSTSTSGSFMFGAWTSAGGALTNGAAATALLSEASNP